MSDRPEVQTASWPISAVDVATLVSNLVGALGRLPFRNPWRGPSHPPRNMAVSVTRELVRTLLGYATSLPIDEFRSLERILDGIAGQVLPPFVALQGVASEVDNIGAVPGVWFRPSQGAAELYEADGSGRSGTIIYLHGGGYIGTSPRMYSLFMAHLVRVTGCSVFAADYRLAPEFPFPAAVDDAICVIGHLMQSGLPCDALFIAGDSGGGGLLGTVLHRMRKENMGRPAGALLFSPEVSLTLSEESITDNAPFDVLPWNIPVSPYLHGVDPDDDRVDILIDDFGNWPPTFLAYGGDEMFRDAIRELVRKLHSARVPHVASEVEGMFHVFPFLLPWTRESRNVYDQAGDFVKAILGQNRCPMEPSRHELATRHA